MFMVVLSDVTMCNDLNCLPRLVFQIKDLTIKVLHYKESYFGRKNLLSIKTYWAKLQANRKTYVRSLMGSMKLHKM